MIASKSRRQVRIISATKSDTIWVKAEHAKGLEEDVNRFIAEMPPSSILDIKLLSVGTRDAWAMIIYDEAKKE